MNLTTLRKSFHRFNISILGGAKALKKFGAFFVYPQKQKPRDVRLKIEAFFTIPYIAVRRNFYHKVSCLFESSSGTLTGSSGLL